MTKHPRQSDLDRLVKAAMKSGLPRWQVVLREVDGKVEPALIVDERAVQPGPDEVSLG